MMDGYLYNKDGVKFTIGDDANLINDNEYGVIVEVPFYNKRVRGNITILKYGEDVVIEQSYKYNKILLEGVKFNIYALENIINI